MEEGVDKPNHGLNTPVGALDFPELLRGAGLKVTGTRLALLQLVGTRGRHMTADEITAGLHKIGVPADRVTVYRNIDKLLRAGSVDEQKKLMRQYEKRALDEQAHMMVSLWWYKINPHRSYVQGWKIAPSHYLNQQLDNVWLDKSKM